MAAAIPLAFPGVRNALGRMFTTPNAMMPKEAPPTPTTDSAPVQEASAQAAARRSRSAGFRSTIISKQNSLLSQIGQPALKDTIGS